MLSGKDYDNLHLQLDFHQYSPFILNELDVIDRDWRAKKILEVGCGQGGHANFFENENSLGIDISQIAIAKAQKKFPNKKFQVANVLTLETEQVYDFVIDSKLINCLDQSAVKLYLQKIKHHGVFLAEVAFHPQQYTSIAHRYFYLMEEFSYVLDQFFKYKKLTQIKNFSYATAGLFKYLPVYTVVASNSVLF